MSTVRAALALAISIWICCAQAQPVSATVFRFPLADTPAAKAIEIFVSEMEKRSAGKLKLELRTPGTPAEVVASIQDGRGQIGIVSTYALGRFDPSYQVFTIPFVFEDLGAVARFQRGEGGQLLAKSLRAKGVDSLSFVHEGMSSILADRPLRLPTDLKGKKLATLAGQNPTAEIWAKLGATQATTNVNQVVPMLISGTVQAYAGPPTLVPPAILPPQIDVLTATRHEYLGYVLIANAKFLEALPQDLFRNIRGAALEAGSSANTLAIQRIRSQLAAYQKSGVEVVSLKPSELAAWKTASINEWAKYEAVVGKHVLQLARASGTGGGGDPCPVLQECRCTDRTCKVDCCK